MNRRSTLPVCLLRFTSPHLALRHPVPLVSLGLVVLSACGGPAEESAVVEADLTANAIRCLPGIDDDGDGLTDRHDLSLGLVTVTSAQACRRGLGGAIWGGGPRPARSALSLTSGGGREKEVGLPDGVEQAAKNSGIPDRPYRKDPQPDGSKGYDCDDFAGDMEKHLTQEGFDATFTLITYYDGEGRVDSAHAVTDIHPAGGGTAWIEPQTGKPITLDQNGDGEVGTGNAYDGPTEGQTGIEIFDSYEEAAKKYRMD